jgi:hypothetical protein
MVKKTVFVLSLNYLRYIVNNVPLFITVLIFVNLFSCANTKMIENQKREETFIENIEIDTIIYNVSYTENNLLITYPKERLIDKIDTIIDLYKNHLNGTKRDNKYLLKIDKFKKMKKLLLKNDKYKILNIFEIDSLNSIEEIVANYHFIQSNIEVEFRFLINDFLCELLEDGEVSIIREDKFLDKIERVKVVLTGEEMSYESYYIIRTSEGENVCKCPPYE